MALSILNPDSTTSNSPAWTLNGAVTVNAAIADDDGDSTTISATATGKSCTIGFDNLSVDNLNTINSVQIILNYRHNSKGATGEIRSTLITTVGSTVEALSTTPSQDFRDLTYTVRTIPIAGSTWTEEIVNGTTVNITLTGLSAGTMEITHCYLNVEYSTSIPTYTSNDNTQNLVLKDGTLNLKGGIIRIK